MTERTAKRKAKVRDGGRCRLCGRGSVWRLHGHHIYPKAQYPELVAEVSNILTLCCACHLQIVHGADIADGAKPNGRWRMFTLFFRWLVRTRPRHP